MHHDRRCCSVGLRYMPAPIHKSCRMLVIGRFTNTDLCCRCQSRDVGNGSRSPRYRQHCGSLRYIPELARGMNEALMRLSIWQVCPGRLRDIGQRIWHRINPGRQIDPSLTGAAILGCRSVHTTAVIAFWSRHRVIMPFPEHRPVYARYRVAESGIAPVLQAA